MKKGQALLMLLVFMVIAITVTSAAVSLVITNSINAQKVQSGEIALQVAESGAEEGLMQLLRNPYYTGETLTVSQGSAIITVTGSSPNYTLTSVGTNGNFTRKIQVVVNYTVVMTVTSWKEVH